MTDVLHIYPGAARKAADHILRWTSLGDTPALTRVHNDVLTLHPSPDYRMSSGEQVLFDLLASILHGAPFALTNLYTLDVDTRRVAVEAVGLGAGVLGALAAGRASS